MNKKILVVDDEADLCALIKRFLEATGRYSVITTTLPEEAEGICKKEKPDLVLLDIVMPQMKGTELIKILRTDPQTSRIKIVVTSGGGEMTYSREEKKWSWQPNRPLVYERGEIFKEKSHSLAAERYGVDDYLAKPFPPAFLLQVVDDLFNNDKNDKNDISE
ncbi:MAG: response regulator [Candidatus Omnitrophota bacterium]